MHKSSFILTSFTLAALSAGVALADNGPDKEGKTRMENVMGSRWPGKMTARPALVRVVPAVRK